MRHPAVLLCPLALLSATLGTLVPGPGWGEAPRLGLHLVLAGVWFGGVVALGTWQWGQRSGWAAAVALIGTWVGWELAVNLALQMEDSWLKPTPLPPALTLYACGLAAGALGALITWAGVAANVDRMRTTGCVTAFVVTGAVLGLLLGLTHNYDSAAVLLVPWQTAVAAVLGHCLIPGRGARAAQNVKTS